MTIEERLENMERELGRHKRRNRWLLGAILLLAGGMIILRVFETTASRAMEIRARGIRIEDENGKRGLLGSEGLMLFDENGKTRAEVDLSKRD